MVSEAEERIAQQYYKSLPFYTPHIQVEENIMRNWYPELLKEVTPTVRERVEQLKQEQWRQEAGVREWPMRTLKEPFLTAKTIAGPREYPVVTEAKIIERGIIEPKPSIIQKAIETKPPVEVLRARETEERFRKIGELVSKAAERVTEAEKKIVTETDYEKYLSEFKKYEEIAKYYEEELKKEVKPVTIAEKIEFKYAELTKPLEKQLEKIGAPKWLTEPKYEFSVTDLMKIVIFSPLFETAAAAKVKGKAKLVAIKEVKEKIRPAKAQILSYLRTQKTLPNRLDAYRKVIEEIGKAPISYRQILLEKAKDIFREAYKAKVANLLFREFAAQEAIIMPKPLPRVLPKPIPKVIPKPPVVKIPIPKEVILKGAGLVPTPALIKPVKPSPLVPPPPTMPKIKPSPPSPRIKFLPTEEELAKQRIAAKEAAASMIGAIPKAELMVRELAKTKPKITVKEMPAIAARPAITGATLLGTTTAQKQALRLKYRYAKIVKPYIKPVLKRIPKLMIPIPTRAPPRIRFKKPRPFFPRPEGYVAYVKRYKKWKPISPVVKRGEAIWFGKEKAIRTLAATFRIKKVAYPITRRRYPQIVKPSPLIFREYKIRKGVRIPTPEEFIQRREYRLMSPSERREIQAAKKSSKLFSFRRKKK